MTGREQVKLDAFAELVTASLSRIEERLDGIDTRTRNLEQASAHAAGAADGQQAAVAHANVVNQRIETQKASRRDSLRTIFAVAASSASIASLVVGVLLTLLRT